MSLATLAAPRGDLRRTALAAAAGAALLAVASQIRIPMWPVPMTMQPFAVLLIAGGLPRRAAIGAVVSYLGLALAGLPVLAGSTGIGGPTTGYLLSYLVVAAVVPALRPRGAAARAGSLLLAMAIIYACGAGWLAAFYTHSIPAALAAGVLPFLPGDAIKLTLAFACLCALPRRAA